MTVEELIERLKQFDPNLPVTVWNGADWPSYGLLTADDVWLPNGGGYFDKLKDSNGEPMSSPPIMRPHVRIG